MIAGGCSGPGEEEFKVIEKNLSDGKIEGMSSISV